MIMSKRCLQQIHFALPDMLTPGTAIFPALAAAVLVAATWAILQTASEDSRIDAGTNRSAVARPDTRTLFEDCQIRMQPTDSRCD
jgi:hypothetical protein